MLSLYIHIPFCLKKCGYCDFHSVGTRPEDVPQGRYISALIKEAETQAERYSLKGENVDTVYFGGGTPTIFDPGHLGLFLDRCSTIFSLSSTAEISIESNPETLTLSRAYQLSGLFSRISIGIQTFDDARLKELGRIHDKETARNAVRAAKKAGFKNIGIDLMWGLKGQDTASLGRDLSEALGLAPQHISAYQLTLEHRSPVHQVDDDMAAEMFMTVDETLTKAGFEHYEISNFALISSRGQAASRFRCRHNENYWRYGRWLGLGSGATSQLEGIRFTSSRDIKRYLSGDISYDIEEIGPATAIKERTFLGLRTSDGIDLESFEKTHPGVAGDWIKRGLASIRPKAQTAGYSLFLTSRGWLISNELFSSII